MTKDEFVKEAIEKLMELMPEDLKKGLEITTTRVMKMNNQELNGLVMNREGVDTSPTIYIDHLYEKYLAGDDAKAMMMEMLDLYKDSLRDHPEIVQPDLSYESIKDNVTILVCVLLCSVLFFFGDETSDDYFTATGDVKITQVAAAQIGNQGGRKFWKWYGYSERVDWCAIFISWCANQCGYIKSGIIPKFAGVPAGVDWFVSKDQFCPNTYIPKPGDIIFIDWGGDGTRDLTMQQPFCQTRTVSLALISHGSEIRSALSKNGLGSMINQSWLHMKKP